MSGAAPLELAWSVHAPGAPPHAITGTPDGAVTVSEWPPFVVVASATDANGRVGADSISVAADGSLAGGDMGGFGVACPAIADAELSLLLWGPAAPEARLRVYDTAGRLCADWLPGGHAGGARVVTRRTADLRSGVYFCRFSAGPLQQVRRIVVVH